jgi:hypothetical protein
MTEAVESRIEEMNVDVEGGVDKHTQGLMRVKHLSRPERLARGWKAASLCIGIAIIAIFIPGLHFILVPGFLIAAPFAFSWQYGWESLILPAELTCPYCSSVIHIAQNKEKWPFHEVCTKCRNEVTITRR